MAATDSITLDSRRAARGYWVRMLSINIALAATMVGATVLARRFGFHLPVYVALPVFLTLNSLLQPPFPGLLVRPRWRRVLFTLTIASGAGLLLWFVERTAS